MLRVLVPDAIDVTPGVPVDLAIALINDGAAAVRVSTRLIGLDTEWIAGLDGPVEVGAGERVDLPITITMPPGFPAGAQLIGVEADVEGEPDPALASLQLVVESLDGISFGLSPASFRGGFSGRFHINLSNRGARPITLRLSGRDEGRVDDGPGGLTFRFKPEEVTVNPGDRARTRGVVKGRRPTIGAPRTRAIAVVAQSNSVPIYATGRFTQRPLLSRRALRMVGLLLVVGMWAGALISAVQYSQDRREEAAAADASSEDDGTDGTGDGDGEDDDGVDGPGEGVRATGATISGQVGGLADRSGVKIDLRKVSFADRLPANVELASSTRSISGQGKVLARTLDLEPAGPIGPTSSTSTDGEGFWAFGGLDAPATYELTFSKAGFAQRAYIVTVEEEGGNVALEVTLSAGDGDIAGRVLGPDGPLGGVAIVVTDGTMTFRTTTPTTGSNVGSWSIAGLATPGSYLVTASRHGYGTETVAVTLGAGGSRTGVELSLVPGVGSIAGRVSGVGGTPVGGVLVTAASEAVTRSVTTLTEAPVGTFLLPQLPIPGSYTLTVTGDGWVPQTLRVDLEDNVSDVAFELVATIATVSGVVSGPDGPLPAVGVTVSQDDPLVKTLTAADPPGSYEVSGLAPGTYVLSFNRFGYEPQSTIVEVEAGDRSVVDITLEEQPESARAGDAVVRGIVRSGTSGDPIAGVTVAAGSSTVTSNADGAFVVEGLAAGTYDVTFTHARHQETSRVVRLATEADVTIDVTMLPFGGVQGQVTDLTAVPLVGVTVAVAAAAGTAAVNVPSVTTNAEGEYSILEALPTGSYVLTFTKAGFGVRTRDFEAAAGSVATVDITLLELAKIHGTIQVPSSAAAGGFELLLDAIVKVSRVESSGSLTVITADADPDGDGEYLVENLLAGNYRVEVSKSGFTTVTKNLDDIKLREVRDGSVVLTPGGQTIEGHVFWMDGTTKVDVVGATVSTTAVTGFRTIAVFPFILPDTTPLPPTTTDSTGDWSLFGQISGTTSSYTISKLGFTTKVVPITAPQTAPEETELVPLPQHLRGTIRLVSSEVPATTVDVTVSLSGPTAKPDQTLTLSTSGAAVTYNFLTVQPGTYTIAFTAPGYAPTSVTKQVLPMDVTTTQDAPAAELEKFARATIAVTSSVSGNPVLPGVDVTLVHRASGDTVGTETTDVNGEALFEDLAKGTYDATLTLGGYETKVVDFTLAPGDDATVDVRLDRFSELVLTVRSLLNGATSALSGATVFAHVQGDSTPIVPDDETANVFTFSGLEPGTYEFEVSEPTEHEPVTVTQAVVAGTDYDLFADLPKHPSLTVTVQRKADGATPGAFDDAEVVAYPLEGTVGSARSTTLPSVELTRDVGDPAGEYTSVTRLAPGWYEVEASADFHDADVVAVEAVAGTDLTDADLVDPVDGTTPDALVVLAWPTVSIEVTSSAGGVVLGANAVTAFRLELGARVDAGTALLDGDGDGTYVSPDGLAPGTYEVEADADDHAVGVTPTFVLEAGEANHSGSLELARFSSLTVTVEQLSNESATTTFDGATVQAHRLEGAVGSARDTTATPIDLDLVAAGVYLSDGFLAPGWYEVEASADFHDADVVAVEAVAGTDLTDADLVDPVDGTTADALVVVEWPEVTVTVLRQIDAGTPSGYLDASVRAHRLLGGLESGRDGSAAVPFTSIGAGSYRSDERLAPGTYEIEASATFHDLDFVAVVVVAGPNLTDADLVDPDGGGGRDDELVVLAWPTVSVSIDDSNGDVVSGAAVRAYRLESNARVDAGTLLDEDGTTGVYTSATGLQPGTYEIEAVKTGFETAATDPFTTVAGGANASETLTLSAHSTLVVTLKSKSGSTLTDLPGGTVTVDGGGTFTDNDDGTYTLNGTLSPGAHPLNATAPGHNAKSGSVTATAGQPATATLELDKHPTLSVTVNSRVADQNGSGATVNVDSPLTTANVRAVSPSTASCSATSPLILTHVGDGVYQHVHTGSSSTTVRVCVFATGHTSQTNATTATLSPGGVNEARTVNLAALPGSISGKVVDLTGGNLSGVTVTAISPNGHVKTTTTNGSGAYGFDSGSNKTMAPLTWSVTFSKDTYSPLTQSVTVLKDTVVTANATLVQLGGTITGAIHQKASDLVEIGVDNPTSVLNGATVEVWTTEATPALLRTATPTDNLYTFANLAPATYQLRFSKTGYQGGGQLTMNVAVAAAAIVTAPNAVLYLNTGTITARAVRTGDAAAISTDPVSYTLTGPLVPVAAGYTKVVTGGEVQFTGVPPGSTYSITATGLVGLREVTGSVGADVVGAVASEQDTIYSEQFQEIGSVEGSVTVDDGGGADPAENATVTLVGTALDGSAVSLSTQTNASGDFDFAIVPVSDATGYTVSASLGSTFSTGEETGVAVARGATTTVPSIALSEEGSLVVTVVDDIGAPVTGASVTISTTGGPVIPAGTTNGSGVVTFSGLDADTYDIAVTAAGHFSGSGSKAVSIGAAAALVEIDRHVTLTFEVTDADGGAPIDGATVQLAGANSGSASTDAAGVATFTEQRPGATSATVSHADYDTEPVASAPYDASTNPNTIPVALTLTPPPPPPDP